MSLKENNTPETIVKEYLLQKINLSELKDDVNIFEEGLVNSLFAIELMTFLEKSFHIKITMEDLNMDNFSSINSIKNFLKSKQATYTNA